MLRHPERWSALRARYEDEKPRKMLALDGGGIRGLITLGILAEMEDRLRKREGGGDEFRLCHFFDYIAGTSTGAEESGSFEDLMNAPHIPLGQNLGRAFLYARYSADLSREGLDKLGFKDVDPKHVQKLDSVDYIDDLLRVCHAAGKEVKTEHFGSFVKAAV